MVCAVCKHCKKLAVAKLQAPAEMHEPEARFSEANACIRQRWILLHLVLHVQRHNSFFAHARGTISCALDSRSVDEQMSLRGIGAGSAEKSRSGGGGWTA